MRCNGYFTIQMIIDGHGIFNWGTRTIHIFHSGTLVTEVLFAQFLIRFAAEHTVANKDA